MKVLFEGNIIEKFSQGYNNNFIESEFRSLERLLKNGAKDIRLKKKLLKKLKHVLVIADGMRRYAYKNKIKFGESYYLATRKIVEISFWLLKKFDIEELTIYALAYNNLLYRDPSELEPLYEIIDTAVQVWINTKPFIDLVKIKYFGFIDVMPDSVKNNIELLENLTKNNKKKLNILWNYSGQREILEAIKTLNITKNNLNTLTPESFMNFLMLKSPIDYIIRTGGDLRISDAPLYQTSYAEFYSIKKLFPETTEKDIIEALRDFNIRERRFSH